MGNGEKNMRVISESCFLSVTLEKKIAFIVLWTELRCGACRSNKNRIPTAEYNPFECVKTNINGAMNLIDAAIDQGVKNIVAQQIKQVALLTYMAQLN